MTPLATRDAGPAMSVPTPASTNIMTPGQRLYAAGIVYVTLAAAIVGTVVESAPLRGIAVSVFLLVFVGMAPCLLLKPMSLLWFSTMSLATSLSTTLGLGFVMSATHFWHPLPIFVGTAVAAVVMLVPAVIRDIRQLPVSEPATPDRAFPASWRINATTAVGLLIAAGTALTHRTSPQPGGLFATLGFVWFLGLLVIIVCAVWAQRSGVSPAFPVLSLASVVVMSQAITYGSPAVMSAARHVGIVDYIRAHHGVDMSLDIYQTWSGLFAGIAWVCDIGGISDPMVIAAWWPVLLSPASALAVAAIASRWMTGRYRIWLAAAIFALTSTLNIVYFSPQSVGLFWALVIFAVLAGPPRLPLEPSASVVGSEPEESALRPVSHRRTAWDGIVRSRFGRRHHDRVSATVQGVGIGRLAFVFYISCAMAVTHQISPYLTVSALVVLCFFGYVRPWWTPILVLAPALVWAWMNQGVLGGFVSLGAVGQVVDNVQPPEHDAEQFAQPLVTRLAFYVPAFMLLLLGILAVVQAVRVRVRYAWALLAAAASAGALLVATDYGQEGIFRVTLFAVPWLAVLAATTRWSRPRWKTPLLFVGLTALLAVNVYGQTALDWNRVVRQDAAEATRLYEQSAQDGSVLLLTGTTNATPLGITARYAEVGYLSREGLREYPKAGVQYDAASDVDTLTRDLVKNWPSPEYYALVSDSIGAYDERYGFQYYSDYLELADAMADSPLWVPVFKGPTTTLYALKNPAALESAG
jgi:hypothetical protein